MSEFTFQPATREGIKLLIGFFGKSGGGKTFTALLVARGIVGPKGKIGLIDSERRRGSIFADMVPGGYTVMNLQEPFTPERYAAAFKAAQEQVDIVVIDQMTSEWNGEGGVLEMQEAELERMAGSDYRKRDACKMAAWIKPKMSHNKFVREILRSAIPVICVMRGKDKTHVVEKEDAGDNGGRKKSKVVTDDFSSPIYDSDFIYEMLVCGEIYQKDGHGGFFRPEKLTHPDIWGIIPNRDQQWMVEHGAALAAWAAGGGNKPKPQTQSKTKDERDTVKAAIWKVVKANHADAKAFEDHLLANGIIKSDETLAELPIERLREVAHDLGVKL